VNTSNPCGKNKTRAQQTQIFMKTAEDKLGENGYNQVGIKRIIFLTK
jgi:hypothetical protein